MSMVTCRSCGQTFAADLSSSPSATTCPHCHAAVEAEPAHTYSSGLAITALVLGLVSLCITPLGLIAVILGIVALVQIANRSKLLTGRGKAVAGIVLGSLAMVVITPVLTIAILLPALRVAQQQARSIADVSNLHQIMIVVHTYANDYDGMLPQTADQLSVYVPDGRILMSPLAETPNTFAPTARRAGTLMRFGDVIFVSHKGPLDGMSSSHSIIIAMSAYSSGRGGQRGVAFVDGHVETVSAIELQRRIGQHNQAGANNEAVAEINLQDLRELQEN